MRSITPVCPFVASSPVSRLEASFHSTCRRPSLWPSTGSYVGHVARLSWIALPMSLPTTSSVYLTSSFPYFNWTLLSSSTFSFYSMWQLTRISLSIVSLVADPISVFLVLDSFILLTSSFPRPVVVDRLSTTPPILFLRRNPLNITVLLFIRLW